MDKIAFTCNWGETSNQLLDIYKKQTPNSLGVWKEIKGIDNIFDADYIVALGPISSDGIHQSLDSRSEAEINHIHKNSSKIIQFRREPDIVEQWKPLENSLCNFDYETGFHACDWWIDENYTDLIDLEYQKTKDTSIIASTKWPMRNSIIHALCKHMPYSFDVFGWPNIQQLFDNQTYKGHCDRKNKDLTKSQALIDYSKSVAIENSSQSNYWSEKIVDCILLYTMPIYWGCPNISEYLPEKSYRMIDIQDLQTTFEIIKEPITPIEVVALGEARDLILNKYNIWETIYKQINN